MSFTLKSVLYKPIFQLCHESYFPFSQAKIIITKFFKNSPHTLFDVETVQLQFIPSSFYLLGKGEAGWFNQVLPFFTEKTKMCPTGWNEWWGNLSLYANTSFCLVLLCIIPNIFIIKKSVVSQH